MPEEKKFPRGAKPTPRHKLAAAVPFRHPGIALPAGVIYAPKLSMWGNDQYGDCVTAEEAFNKSASGFFFSDDLVVAWAQQNGFRDGADLMEVMQAMNKSGFPLDGKTYGDGPAPLSVDYSNEAILQAALTVAPVKIGIDANALPSGAGNASGWFGHGGSPGQFTSEDHCVAIAGYGTAAYLAEKLGVPVPAGADPTKIYYALYTWKTIGLVDHDWIMSTTGEAWLRNPSTTVDGQPQPNPGPGPNPTPTPTPTPTPVPPIPAPGPEMPTWGWIALGGAAVAIAALAVVLATKK